MKKLIIIGLVTLASMWFLGAPLWGGLLLGIVTSTII